MADLNNWSISGRVKSITEINGGIGCVSVDIECHPFDGDEEEVFTFSFRFFGKDKERLMATVAPGNTITVSGKLLTDQNGCPVIINYSWSLVSSSNACQK